VLPCSSLSSPVPSLFIGSLSSLFLLCPLSSLVYPLPRTPQHYSKPSRPSSRPSEDPGQLTFPSHLRHPPPSSPTSRRCCSGRACTLPHNEQIPCCSGVRVHKYLPPSRVPLSWLTMLFHSRMCCVACSVQYVSYQQHTHMIACFCSSLPHRSLPCPLITRMAFVYTVQVPLHEHGNVVPEHGCWAVPATHPGPWWRCGPGGRCRQPLQSWEVATVPSTNPGCRLFLTLSPNDRCTYVLCCASLSPP
jgi:hypothetical protein